VFRSFGGRGTKTICPSSTHFGEIRTEECVGKKSSVVENENDGFIYFQTRGVLLIEDGNLLLRRQAYTYSDVAIFMDPAVRLAHVHGNSHF